MKRAITKKLEPEQGMTRDDAREFASIIGSHLLNQNDDSPAVFLLLLRWFSYKATQDDMETIYIQTEGEYASFLDGVDGAVLKTMQQQLTALRQRQQRKGGKGR